MASTKVSRIGKYEVLDVLGRGGMGVVYKATDPAIGRLVAIKMITSGYAEDPAFLRRFYREAQSTGKLQHQNIVIVHELGDQDGTPFLVMEFLEGESLQSIISSQAAMPLLEKLDIIIQTCNGLHYAHQRNIVHRDIKPGNLMVLKDGVVKIVDFGIARVETENVTMPGQVMGSIQYMSPEQINGISVDCRTDIFSTGVVLYQLLTYNLPFQGKDTGSTLLKIINEPPPPLQNYLDVYPPDLEAVVHRALAKSREQRYPTAEDFAFDLSQVQEQLKRELISEYLKVAEDLIARSELSRAKEQVFQILRIDRQNRRANEMLRAVQRLIQTQQRSEQARQLKAQAQEAIEDKELDRAIAYLDEAITLTPEDTELQQLRDQTRESKERQQKMHEAIHRAESAQWAGDLTAALAAAEEAMGVDATNAEVRSLLESIRNEINERRRQQQMQDLLGEAQRQISSRRFTAAIEALHKAEAIDPNAPAVKDLLALAASGQEQERRRKEIEQLTTEIQDAINHDDYRAACEKANAAVQRFPNERALLKLQTLAERQRQAGERRHFVEEQISQARKLLEARQTSEALAVLEAACKRYPTEAALLSMVTVVRENLEQERIEARKNEYIQQAKEALRAKDFEQAISVLETAHAELHVPEIEDLLQFAKDEAASFRRRQAVDAAAHEAHRMLAAEQYEDAIKFLEGLLQEVTDEELEILLADAKRQLAEFNRRVNDALNTADRLLRVERVIEAVRYLESQVDTCGKSAEFCAMLERARNEQERMRAIAAAVQSARTALANQDFDGASHAIESCRKNVGDHPDLSRIAADIDAQRRDAATKAVAKAVADSRMLLLGRSYQSAIELLDSMANHADLVPQDVRDRYEALRDEARRGLERTQAEADSRAAARSAAEEEGTQEQVSWPAPSAGSVSPSRTRERDLEELTQLGKEWDTVTNVGALEAVAQRARLIAKRHPGDSQLETVALTIAQSAEQRAHDLATCPAETPAATVSTPTDGQASVAAAPRPSERAAPSPPPTPEADATVVATPAPLERPSTPAPPPAEEPAAAPPPKKRSASPPAAKKGAVAPTTAKAKPAIVSPRPPERTRPPEPPATPHPAVLPQQETVAMPAPANADATVLATPDVARTPVQLDAAVPETHVEPPSVTPAPGPTLVPPPKPAPSGRLGLYAGAGAVLLAIIGLVVWLLSSGSAGTVVTVQTTPEGATVKVKDASCVTPNCKLTLKPGTYDVGASLRGYAPASSVVQVESGKPAPAINLALRPLQPSVRINSNFTDGKVWLDSREVGTLKNGQLTLSTLAPGNHALRVSGRDGEADLTFNAEPAQAPAPSSPVRARNISVLTVSTLAGTTRVDCNCEHSISLAVDGRSMGELSQAGRDLGNIGEGIHEFKVGAGEDIRTASVKLEAAPSLDVFVNAERNAGTLVVETNAEGAEVFVNNKPYQRTAGGTLRIPLDAKNYTIRVEKPGYEPVNPQQVDIHKNQETRVTFNLTPKEQKGFVALRGALAGARVNIDGKSIGQVDRNGRFRSPSLPAGQHVISLEKDGYQARKIDANIKSGETVDLSGNDVEMAKVAPPPAPAPATPAKTTAPSTPTPPSPAPAIDPAKADWDRIANSSDPNALRGYVNKYPASPYTAEANRKLEQLDWSRVHDSNDAAQLQAFLSKYPNGQFAAAAHASLDKIRVSADKSGADRMAVLQTIRDYAAAYESKSVDKLTAVYPGLDKQQVKRLKDVFKTARSVKMTLEPKGDPQIKGDSATVICQRSAEYVYPEGPKKPPDDTVTIQLKKKGSSWVMESVQ